MWWPAGDFYHHPNVGQLRPLLLAAAALPDFAGLLWESYNSTSFNWLAVTACLLFCLGWVLLLYAELTAVPAETR